MAPFVSLEFLRRLAYFNMQIEKLLIHDSLILGIPATSLHRWRTLKGEFFSDVLKLHFQKKNSEYYTCASNRKQKLVPGISFVTLNERLLIELIVKIVVYKTLSTIFYFWQI